MILFSVVIPLYNKSDFIERCISSVLKQTLTNFEIIIINDGSTDESLKKLEKYQKHKHLRIIDQENHGLAYTRNKGFELANGEYVAFLDADDFWNEDFLTEIKISIDKFPEFNIYGTSYKKQIDGKLWEANHNLDESQKGEIFVADDFFTANLREFIPCHSSIVLRKKALALPLYNENLTYFEDVAFFLDQLTKHEIVVINKPLATIEFSESNQMSKSSLKKKKFPNFQDYKTKYRDNSSVIKYIDMQLYKLAIKCALDGLSTDKQRLLKQIDLKNLTSKQRFLINQPSSILRLIIGVKKLLLKLGLRLTSF